MKINILKKALTAIVLFLTVSVISLLFIFALPIMPAKAAEVKYTESPVITILTHGAGVTAGSWTSGSSKDISSNPESIVEELYNKNRDMDIYQITYKSESKNKYESRLAHPGASKFLEDNHSDIIYNSSKHLLLVYDESSVRNGDFATKHFSEIYSSFETVFMSVVGQYYEKFGKYPRINLIGHSLGGVLNLVFALNHANLIDSMFSLGTPYNGSFIGDVFKNSIRKHFGQAVFDIIDGDILGYSIMDNIRKIWNERNLGEKINTYAYVTHMDLDFLTKMCLFDQQTFVPKIVYRSLGLILGRLRAKYAIEAMSRDTMAFIVSTLIKIVTACEPPEMPESAVENAFKLIIDWSAGDPHFTTDFFLTSHSQGGFGYNGVTPIYRTYDISTDVTKKSANGWPAIQHNLQQQDRVIIKSIVSKINLGTTIKFNTRSVDGGCVITGVNECVGDTLNIPDKINDVPVIGIDDYALAYDCYMSDYDDNETQKTKIKTVNIPKSVKSIGANAFYKCSNLEKVIFASDSSLTSIGQAAFYESGVNEITIPDKVTEIWDYAFFNCENLTEINLPASLTVLGIGVFGYNNLTNIKFAESSDFVVDDGILYNEAKTEIFTLLRGNEKPTKPKFTFNMLDSVKTIHSYAFAGSSYTDITMSNTISTIEWGAFENCKSLTRIELPSTLRDVRSNAFNGCENLGEVQFESEVVPDFGWGVFDGNAENRKIFVPGLAEQNYLSDERLQAYRSDITTLKTWVIFNTNGDEEIDPMLVDYDKGITLPTPERSGYEFLAWYFDEELTDEFYASRWHNKETNTTLYAKWQVLDYSINYYDADTNNPITDSGNEGFYAITKIVFLSPAVKEGYTFIGWYDNIECTGEALRALPNGEIENKQLFAKWEINEYTVNYHDTVTNALITDSGNAEIYNVTQTITLLPVAKSGYTFMGWYDNSACNGQAIESLPNGNLENKDLYAKWQINEYTVQYYDSATNTEITNSGNLGVYDVEHAITLKAAEKAG